MHSTGHWWSVCGESITSFAYADDLTVVSGTKSGTAALLSAAENAARVVGLTFNPTECVSLHIMRRGLESVQPTRITIHGGEIKSLASNDACHFPGVPTGY